MGFIGKIGELIGLKHADGNFDRLLARAQALREGGQAREAVRLLQREAARSLDGRLHMMLIGLRREAADESCRAAQARADWPPNLADPFPHLIGIPEIEASSLNATLMGGAILHHGSLLVRGLLTREEADMAARDVDRALQAYDDWSASASPESSGAWYSPFPMGDGRLSDTRHWMRDSGNVFAADSPICFAKIVDLYQRKGVTAAIEEYLGERAMLSAGKTVLRRISPTNVGDFHQDGAFLGADIRTVNVWIALSDCGIDAPGLEIVDRRLPGITETGSFDANFAWSVGRKAAQAQNDDRPFARPIFKAGDALIFDQLMLHATSYDASMTKDRWALEAWFFAPSAYAADQIALYV